ncbi:MAG: hypothetical protein HOK41_01410 [Nitrospina sp.]|nr:hypothetical protein [Nitrospina sp.]
MEFIIDSWFKRLDPAPEEPGLLVGDRVDDSEWFEELSSLVLLEFLLPELENIKRSPTKITTNIIIVTDTSIGASY